jgi:hypothetical protein
MIKALGNVMPRHLLDRRLNPIAEMPADLAKTLARAVPDAALADRANVPLIPLMLK